MYFRKFTTNDHALKETWTMRERYSPCLLGTSRMMISSENFLISPTSPAFQMKASIGCLNFTPPTQVTVHLSILLHPTTSRLSTKGVLLSKEMLCSKPQGGFLLRNGLDNSRSGVIVSSVLPFFFEFTPLNKISEHTIQGHPIYWICEYRKGNFLNG